MNKIVALMVGLMITLSSAAIAGQLGEKSAAELPCPCMLNKKGNVKAAPSKAAKSNPASNSQSGK